MEALVPQTHFGILGSEALMLGGQTTDSDLARVGGNDEAATDYAIATQDRARNASFKEQVPAQAAVRALSPRGPLRILQPLEDEVDPGIATRQYVVQGLSLIHISEP